jgi:hypothetical protein
MSELLLFDAGFFQVSGMVNSFTFSTYGSVLLRILSVKMSSLVSGHDKGLFQNIFS